MYHFETVQEVLDLEEEKDSGDEDMEHHEESSEYEEYSESEEEDTGPRLKPVFVRRYRVHTLLGLLKVEKKLEISSRGVQPDTALLPMLTC